MERIWKAIPWKAVNLKTALISFIRPFTFSNYVSDGFQQIDFLLIYGVMILGDGSIDVVEFIWEFLRQGFQNYF